MNNKTLLLDCTLRDGGYINNWMFGRIAIGKIISGLIMAKIDIIELGFLKGDISDINCTLYQEMTDANRNIDGMAEEGPKFAVMIDMNEPPSFERIENYVGNNVSIVRVIFKKNKIELAKKYAEYLYMQGYDVYVQPVGIDQYTDIELLKLVEKFNNLSISAFYIVDSFGVLNRRDFLRAVYLIDNNLRDEISLGYHSHNNLQQAFGNAQALNELNLDRECIIDASIFGMGRGAGNLNEELFASYLNYSNNNNYNIEPLLEVIDRYINKIYEKNRWGYSVPLYLSALNHCHPNYALYYSSKYTLSEKSLNELFRMMKNEDKCSYSINTAERIYQEYMDVNVNDNDSIALLRNQLIKKDVLVIAPGNSINKYKDELIAMSQRGNVITISVNFVPQNVMTDYVFCSNERRYYELQKMDNIIITSNIRTECKEHLIVNYSSLCGIDNVYNDNATIMLMKLLVTIGIREVYVAGLDGYSASSKSNYSDNDMEFQKTVEEVERKNNAIRDGMERIERRIKCNFVTDTKVWSL